MLVSISVPTSGADEYFAAYKQSRRREDDIAIVNAAFRVTFHPQSSRIAQLKMAFGGMAPTTVIHFILETILTHFYSMYLIHENTPTKVLDYFSNNPRLRRLRI